MSKHAMEVNNGHIVLVEQDKRFIIDTGSPISYSREEQTLSVGGEEFKLGPQTDIPLLSSLKNNALSQLAGSFITSSLKKFDFSKLVDGQIDGLLGLDILKDKSWEFVFASNRILVNEESDREYDNALALKNSLALVFKVKVNGNDCQGLLDTGAFVSYASAKLVEGIPSCGTLNDYNPQLGKINTTKHKVNIQLCGQNFDHEVGKMTGMLNLLMTTVGIDFLMGITPLGLSACRLDLKKYRLEF